MIGIKQYIQGGFILAIIILFFMWKSERKERQILETDNAVLEETIKRHKDQTIKSDKVEKEASVFPIPKLKTYDPKLPNNFKTGGAW